MPAGALALIERERCTVYYGTPNIALALTEHPDRPRRDLASLRTGAAIGSAAGHADGDGSRRSRDLQRLRPDRDLRKLQRSPTPTIPPTIRLHAVGRPLPGMEIRIVDRETRRPLSRARSARSSFAAISPPAITRIPSRTPRPSTAEGFLLTGDLGLIDGDGRLRFRGRIKEMVKTGGINVAPLEIEEVLLGHPAVEQAYVVGLPDPRKEEILAAVVVLKRRPRRRARRRCGHSASDALRGVQGAADVPDPDAASDLPVTATGKVQKFRLAEPLAREGAAPGA